MTTKDAILSQVKRLNAEKEAKEQTLKDAWKPFHEVILEVAHLIRDRNYSLSGDHLIIPTKWVMFRVKEMKHRTDCIVFEYSDVHGSKSFTEEEFQSEFPKLLAPLLMSPEEHEKTKGFWQKLKNKLTEFLSAVEYERHEQIPPPP
jgi:hypothetical protein